MSKVKFTSPKGTAMWAWFTVPDTQFDAEGKYKTELLMSEADAGPLMKQCKEIFIEEHGEKSVNKAKWPFKTDKEQGTVSFRIKSTKKPTLFDGEGKVINEAVNVGNGSTIKVAGSAATYSAGGNIGVTMYLDAVQIIDLIEYSGAKFEAEEGAYVHKPATQEAEASGSYDF